MNPANTENLTALPVEGGHELKKWCTTIIISAVSNRYTFLKFVVPRSGGLKHTTQKPHQKPPKGGTRNSGKIFHLTAMAKKTAGRGQAVEHVRGQQHGSAGPCGFFPGVNDPIWERDAHPVSPVLILLVLCPAQHLFSV